MQSPWLLQGPPNTVFFCTTVLRLSLLFFLLFFCYWPAYHLSPFLSKDIHQRNMALPSPAALCQLREAGGADCRSSRMRAVTACEHLSPSRRGFNIQQTIALDVPHLDVKVSESELGSKWTSLLHTRVITMLSLSTHHLPFLVGC